ncbi:hypothetical protein [Falsibacillus albus]|uniref:Uncharacterized protein n=1 Tax=Falsibacillus albus TaxID=2478915 RepID=A0A3L7JR56_9BACI|nr:hypothetical protein [Falsibacillus albus]RLQ93293.1 hypothetical protein D9X91_17670 [Falsibacillus albus]
MAGILSIFTFILPILFVIYVLYSLSTIKQQLREIKRHLQTEEKNILVPDEEIEKELEEEAEKYK